MKIQDVCVRPGNKSPRGGKAWIVCYICLNFILYVQAWLFVHGMISVFLNSLTIPYSGEDGSDIHICAVLPPMHLFIGFPFEIPVLINVSPTYTYIYMYTYVYTCMYTYVGKK